MQSAVATGKSAFWSVGSTVAGAGWGAFGIMKSYVDSAVGTEQQQLQQPQAQQEEEKKEEEEPAQNKEIVKGLFEEKKE